MFFVKILMLKKRKSTSSSYLFYIPILLIYEKWNDRVA